MGIALDNKALTENLFSPDFFSSEDEMIQWAIWQVDEFVIGMQMHQVQDALDKEPGIIGPTVGGQDARRITLDNLKEQHDQVGREREGWLMEKRQQKEWEKERTRLEAAVEDATKAAVAAGVETGIRAGFVALQGEEPPVPIKPKELPKKGTKRARAALARWFRYRDAMKAAGYDYDLTNLERDLQGLYSYSYLKKLSMLWNPSTGTFQKR